MAEQQARPEPGADVGILVTIRSLLPNLAPVERRVARAVLDDPQGVAWRSISELARTCGTSATSVVRFCRAIGLRGYPDLRLALERTFTAAQAKAATKHTEGDQPVHSLATLLADLGTICLNTSAPADPATPDFRLVTTPTPLQRQAFEMLGVSHRLGVA